MGGGERRKGGRNKGKNKTLSGNKQTKRVTRARRCPQRVTPCRVPWHRGTPLRRTAPPAARGAAAAAPAPGCRPRPRTAEPRRQDPAPRRCLPGKFGGAEIPPRGRGTLPAGWHSFGQRGEEAEKKKYGGHKNNNNKATPVSEIAPLDQVTMEIIARRQKKKPEATLILSASARDGRRRREPLPPPGAGLRALPPPAAGCSPPPRTGSRPRPQPRAAPRRQRCCPPPHSWNLKGPCSPGPACPRRRGPAGCAFLTKSFPRGPSADALKYGHPQRHRGKGSKVLAACSPRH